MAKSLIILQTVKVSQNFGEYQKEVFREICLYNIMLRCERDGDGAFYSVKEEEEKEFFFFFFGGWKANSPKGK